MQLPMNNNNFNYIPRNNQFSSFNNTSYNSLTNSATSTNNIVWVQGIEGAKAWQLNPNSMVILLDSEVEGKMYIKVSDNIGMSTLRIFDYVEVLPTNNVGQLATNNTQNIDLSQYVRKDELKEIIKELVSDEQSISTVAANSTTTDDKPTTVTFVK